MRTALCLSGQARCIDSNFNSIYDNLILPTNADVFCHFWDSGPGGMRQAEHAVQKLQAKLYKLQPQIDFTLYPGKGNTPLTRSQFYSVKQSNNLKSQYESEHGFTYDWVIRCRTDLVIRQPLDLEVCNRNPGAVYAIYRPGDTVVDGEFIYKEYYPDHFISGWKFCDDTFLVANSINMNLYAMIYDSIEEQVELRKNETFGHWISSTESVQIVGASVPGEAAMIYNQNKYLKHLRAFEIKIAKAVDFANRDRL